MAFRDYECEKCEETSKRVVGFYDNDEKHGVMIDCLNDNCCKKVEQYNQEEQKRKEKDLVRKKNAEAGINILFLEDLIAKKGFLRGAVPTLVKIDLKTWWKLIQEEIPFPRVTYKQVVEKLNEFPDRDLLRNKILKGVRRNNCQHKKLK